MRTENHTREHALSQRATRWAAVLFALGWMYHAVESARAYAHTVPDLNDDVMHLRLVRLVAETLRAGGDPTDPWLSTFAQGFPLLHHYQHLPHAVLGTIVALTGDDGLGVLRASQWLLAVAFPLAVVFCGRRLRLGTAESFFAGLLAVLLATEGLYGLDPSSYGWAGLGLTTQMWGAVLMAAAWGSLRDAIEPGGRIATAGALVALLVLAHTVLAYVTGIVAVVLVALRGRRGWGRRAARAAAVFAIGAIGCAYFVVPFVLDHGAMNRSVWEPSFKVDGYGLAWVVESFARGDLFDGSSRTRLPLVTITVAAGLALAILQRWLPLPHPGGRPTAAVVVVVCLLLYAGRPTWGALLNVLPFSADLHLHRFIAPLHLAGLLLGGSSLGALWELATRRWGGWAAPVAAVLTLLAVAQPLYERAAFYAERRGWLEVSRAAFTAEGDALEELTAALRELPPGRAYAGRKPNWGGEYRIGHVPMYALLSAAGIDNLGYLYHALSPAGDIEVDFDDARRGHYELFDVRYLVAPAGRVAPPFAIALGSFGAHRLYRIDTPGGLDTVDAGPLVRGDRRQWLDAARRWVRSSAVEERRFPIFELDDASEPDEPARPGELPPGGLFTSEARFSPSAPDRPCGVLQIETAAAGSYRAVVDAARACHIVAKTTWHPGFSAWVDGREGPTLRLAPAYVGVAVDAGRHEVELRYVPSPWRAIARWLGALTVAALVVVETWQRRRSGRAARGAS